MRIANEKDEANKSMKEMIGFESGGTGTDIHVNLLSGGEQQKVAIARALYSGAELIMPDVFMLKQAEA
ncbi:MAG: hypothetical protein PHN81_02735 [Actinomycetota bacterium]|nr:hypothetical protein [Actinomycetota bacterium]MDD5600236.1 hypothetical protein [Actinomycetota bacterium]